MYSGKTRRSQTGPEAAQWSARRIVGLGLCVVDHLYVVETLDLSATRTRWLCERVVSTGGMACNATDPGGPARVQCAPRSPPWATIRTAATCAARSTACGSRPAASRLSRELPTTVAVVLVARRGGERRFIVPDRRAIERRAADFDLSAHRSPHAAVAGRTFPAPGPARGEARARSRRDRDRRLQPPGPGRSRAAPHTWTSPSCPWSSPRPTAEGDPRAGTAIHAAGSLRWKLPSSRWAAGAASTCAEGRVRRYPAHRVAVRDTTGAGDAFHGAFAAGALPRRGLRRCAIALARARGRGVLHRPWRLPAAC